MSATERVIAGIKDILVMRDEVKRLSSAVTVLITDVRDLDRRVVRIETIIEMTDRAAQRRLPQP